MGRKKSRMSSKATRRPRFESLELRVLMSATLEGSEAWDHQDHTGPADVVIAELALADPAFAKSPPATPQSNEAQALNSGGGEIIFLDFDGATVQNRAGDIDLGAPSIVIPSFNLSTFGWGGQEQTAIGHIIDFVREDFSAYDITVVDVEPAGVEYNSIFVGGDNNWYSPDSATIGVATHDPDNSDASNYGFVFTEELGSYATASNGNLLVFSEYIANLIGHEAGHNFGLPHVFNTNYLMNSFVPVGNLTQGFGGDQDNDNQLILATNLGYAGDVADDYGNVETGAHPISGNITIAGKLEHRSDTDAFLINPLLNQEISIEIDTTVHGNLDGVLRVFRNDTDTLVASSDDADGVDPAITFGGEVGVDYTVYLSSRNSESSGTYSLRLDQTQPISPPPTLPGELRHETPVHLNHAGNISLNGAIGASEADVFLFSADQGGVVDLGLTAGGFNGQMALYDFSGSQVAAGTAAISQNLAPGSYYVWVGGLDAIQNGSYTLNVDAPWSSRETVIADDNGDAVMSGVLAYPGDDAFFTLNTPANGDGTLTLTVVTSGSEDLLVNLFSASQFLIHSSNSNTSQTEVLDINAGVTPGVNYYASVGTDQASAGAFDLAVDFGVYRDIAPPSALPAPSGRLLHLNQAGNLSVSDGIDAEEADVFLFSTDQAGLVNLSLSQNDFAGQLALFDGNGARIASGDGSISQTVSAGTYHVWIAGQNAGESGNYNLAIDAPWSFRDTVVLNASGDATASGSLNHIGDDSFFTLTAPDNFDGTLSLAAQSANGEDLVINLFSASQFLIGSSDGNTGTMEVHEFGSVAEGGIYYVSVGSADGGTASFDLDVDFGVFAKIDPPVELSTSLMSEAALHLNQAGNLQHGDSIQPQSADVYLFSVDQSGDTHLAINASFQGQMALYDGNGILLAASTDDLSRSLNAGSYYVWVAGADEIQSGSYVLSIDAPWSFRVPVSIDGDGDAMLTGTLHHSGDNAYFTLVTPADSDGTLSLSALSEADHDLVVNLFSASQFLIGSSDGQTGAAEVLTFDSLTPGGTYYASVAAPNGDSGSFNLSVDFGGDSPINPPGTLLPNSPIHLNQAGNLQVTGSVGLNQADTFLFSVDQGGMVDLSVSTDGFNGQLALYDGAGTLITSGSSSIRRSVVAGPYYAWVAGADSSQSGDYSLGIDAPWSQRDAVVLDINGDSLMGGTLHHLGDDAYFTLVTPTNSDGTLTITGHSIDDFDLALSLFSPSQSLIDAVDVNTGKSEILHLDTAVGGATYYLSVGSPSGTSGDFDLSVDFGVYPAIEAPPTLSSVILPDSSLQLNQAGNLVHSDSVGASEADVFLVSVDQFGTLNLALDESGFEGQLALYDSGGELLAADGDAVAVSVSGGSYYVWVAGVDPRESGSYSLDIDAPWSVRETVSLDIDGDALVQGEFAHAGDQSYFALVTPANADGTLSLTTVGDDMVLNIYSPAQVLVYTSDDNSGPTETLQLGQLVAGSTYYLSVGSAGTQAGDFNLAVDYGVHTSLLPPTVLEGPLPAEPAVHLNHVGNVRVSSDIETGEVDLFLFSSDQYGAINLALNGSGFVGQMALYNASGGLIATGGGSITTQPMSAGTYYVRVSGSDSSQAGSYLLDIDAPWSLSQSINLNSQGDAQVDGNINYLGDDAFYTLVVPNNSDGSLMLTSLSGPQGDLEIRLFGLDQDLVAAANHNTGQTEFLSYNSVVPGATYYLSVGSPAGSTGPLTLNVDFGVPAPQTSVAAAQVDRAALFSPRPSSALPARKPQTGLASRVAEKFRISLATQLEEADLSEAALLETDFDILELSEFEPRQRWRRTYRNLVNFLTASNDEVLADVLSEVKLG